MRFYLTAEHIVLLTPASTAFEIKAIREVVAEVIGVDQAENDLYPDLFTRAAAYMSLLRDKRAIQDNGATSLRAAALYLRGNGTTLSLSDEERRRIIEGVHSGAWSEAEIVTFLYDRARIQTQPAPDYPRGRGLWDHD